MNNQQRRFNPLQNKDSILHDIAITNFTPAENHAIYIASLNNANTNNGIKKLGELQQNTWYEVKAFISKMDRNGKMYMTARLNDNEVFLPDRFCNSIVPCDNLNNVYMKYNGLVQPENGYPYHDVSFQ